MLVYQGSNLQGPHPLRSPAWDVAWELRWFHGGEMVSKFHRDWNMELPSGYD